MRTDTLLNLLCRLQDQCPPEYLQEQFKQDILGLIVLTDYNNRTYRVDDVDFGKNPMSTFPRDGRDTTYCTYYKEVRTLV